MNADIAVLAVALGFLAVMLLSWSIPQIQLHGAKGVYKVWYRSQDGAYAVVAAGAREAWHALESYYGEPSCRPWLEFTRRVNDPHEHHSRALRLTGQFLDFLAHIPKDRKREYL